MTEANRGRDRTAAFLIADRFLMFGARNMGEVENTAAVRIGTANELGESYLRSMLGLLTRQPHGARRLLLPPEQGCLLGGRQQGCWKCL